MNDKAKKVLSYVACAIGGACLGIALLGGLSYCSTASAREKADTINTIDRVRHNSNITTDGGYSGYRFWVSNNASSLAEGKMSIYVYSITLSTYQPNPLTYNVVDCPSGVYNLTEKLDSLYETARPTNSNTLNFLCVSFRFSFSTSNPSYFYGSYYSFVLPSASTAGINPLPFIYTNRTATDRMARLDYDANLGETYNKTFVIPNGQCPYFLWNPNGDLPPSSPCFQDINSYYQELGYQDGYSAGETAGNSAGYSSGYSSGYEAGSSAGYESGYDEGFQDGYLNTYYAFTSLIVNKNAIWSMADIPWHSNEDIYIAPGHFNDHPFLDPAILQTNTYVNWAYLALFRDTTTLTPYYIYAQRYTTSQNNGYVDFVIRISPADQTSTENAGNIGSYSGGVSLSETSIFQTEYVTEWTARNRCQLIAWGSDNPQDIDTNWFDSGHILPRGIAVDESAYDQGYKQGQLDAQRNTSMNNVFALFTPAFGAVASFFDMKIFGFLPLYWFLIAPLFIALISLIMRMVKH